jgi:glycosyltransferase involved in cell wall biosynthesis
MLTVLFATRNRAQLLREVLETYCHLQDPRGGWKLVIIDNGSTDETAEIASSFRNHLPLQFVSESRAGKNVALNTGLEHVEGDLAVLTDDDTFPKADWLIQLRRAADDQLAFSMFGGVIEPRWETAPPPWVRWIRDAGPVYTLTDRSLREGPIPGVLVFGPNMAVRTAIFQSGVRFDPAIGPRGSSYAMGSETEILLRLEKQGHRAWHVEHAVVEHFIRKEQLTKEWVLQRAKRWGRGRYRMSPTARLWLGVPRHLFRDFPKEGLGILAAFILFRRKAFFNARWRFNILLGIASEARRMNHEPLNCERAVLTPGSPRK